MAAILMLYMLYPLLHALSQINQKAPLIVAIGIGVAYYVLTSDTPFSGNKAYSLESHWGGGSRRQHCLFDWAVLRSKDKE